MLHIDNLTKYYNKKQIFKDLTFSVEKGEIIGLVGENGAGKSTLLSILATLQTPSAGTLTLNDLSYDSDWKKIRKQIGYVPQEIAIWDEFTVRENMLFFEKLSWVKKTEEELRQLCLEMKLDQWNEPAHTLSGGMKRKLNMAISLIHDPTIILLDEPTVGIDLKSKKEIGSYMEKQAKTDEKTIIYISHDMDEIKSLCTRIICIGQDSFYKNLLQNAGKNVLVF
ncbi:ABC transporter ATP-binding protein [Virgibacillus sp. Bac332]|uniref:ABC transporter ATP-binding protein n=1 Tax=Virgibacillus sp. Bac332 TaxID=2419842 RepID=UPI000EF48581|nr:ABC transporter ATP-binding protein [Virgibacillus sp. Bac332]